MKQHYFTLTEDGAMIGTILAFGNESLTAKAKIAITEHFDCEVSEMPILNEDDYISTDGGTFDVVLEDLSTQTITIQQTWLY